MRNINERCKQRAQPCEGQKSELINKSVQKNNNTLVKHLNKTKRYKCVKTISSKIL